MKQGGILLLNHDRMDEYRLLAPVYDPLLHAVMHRLRKKVVETARHLPHERVIDICCGTGNQLKYFKKAGFSNLTGVDISSSMLEQAGKGNHRVACDEQDASRMSFPDNTFDLGIISFALHEKPLHVSRMIVSEAERIVHPRGNLIVVDYLFEKPIRWPARVTIHVVERFAGKHHYRYFREYIRHGGMNHLMDGSRLTSEYRFHGNASGIRVYSNDKFGQYA